MRTGLWVLLGLLFLSACASVPATPTALPTPSPTQTEVARSPTAASMTNIPYSESLLIGQWDPELGGGGYLLGPVDPVNGAPVPGYGKIRVGKNYYTAFSPDRKLLAVVAYMEDLPAHPWLHLIDLSKWEDWAVELDVTGWVTALGFSPDGVHLAISTAYSKRDLLIFDVLQRMIITHIEPEFEITHLQFTQDGQSLMTYGHLLVDRFTENEHSDGFARVSIFELDNPGNVWNAELTGIKDGIYAVNEQTSTQVHRPGNGIYFQPGVVFTPDDDILYVIHADEDRLTRVDFGSSSITTLDVQSKLSWLERWLMIGAVTAHAKAASGVTRQAVISLDGSTLYTIGMKNEMRQLTNGDWVGDPKWLNLQAIRASDGTILLDEEVHADGLSLDPGGDRLFIKGWVGDLAPLPQMKVFDIASSSFTDGFQDTYPLPARRHNGELILAANDLLPGYGESTRMAVYDYNSGNLLGEWISPTYANWVTGN